MKRLGGFVPGFVLVRVCVLVLVCVFISGCSIPAQSLRSLTVAPSGQTVQGSDKSFLLYPFEDERGEDSTKFPLIDFVPLVDWFYSELIIKYPENSAFLRGKRDGRSVIATGSLPSALPYLLGNLMRQMGFAANWTPLESVDAQRDLKQFDYVIRGKLKSTRLRISGSFLPLGVLGILGIPCIFIDYQIEFDVILLKNQQAGGEIARKSYEWSGKKLVGFYYHWTAAYDLFVEGLNRTLPQVVVDLATVLPH